MSVKLSRFCVWAISLTRIDQITYFNFTLLSVLRWFCCCWFIVYCCSNCLWVFLFGPGFVIQYFVPFLFCNHLGGNRRAGCFFNCLPVVLWLLVFCVFSLRFHWLSAVRDCDIFWSYALIFYMIISHSIKVCHPHTYATNSQGQGYIFDSN